MNENKRPPEPPRVTVAQAIVILVMLVLGYIALENGRSLILLLTAMAIAAFVLNRLLALILWWAGDNTQHNDDEQ